VTKLKMNITTKEDYKADNGRLESRIDVLEKGVKYANEQLADSVTKDCHKRVVNDLKYELGKVKTELGFLKIEKQGWERDYHTEHSVRINIDAECENLREQLRESRNNEVSLLQELEHLRPLMVLYMKEKVE
jgi:predicted RNA-binding protein